MAPMTRESAADSRGPAMKLSHGEYPELRDHDRGSIGAYAIEHGMMKLVNPSVSQNDIEACRQKTRYKDQGQEVDIKPCQKQWKDEKKNKEDENQPGCFSLNPFYQNRLRYMSNSPHSSPLTVGRGWRRGGFYHVDFRSPVGRKSRTMTTAA